MILGLDPGQRRDPAGLAVVDGFDILHLERVLGLPYPDLAERVAMVLAQLPVAYPGPGMRWADPVGGYAGRMRAEVAAIRATPVVVDATGVGRAVVDLLDRRMPVVISVGGGAADGVSGRGVATVPRREVAAGLLLEAQRGTFRTASTLPLAPRFEQALRGFRFKAQGTTGGDALEEARREADDALVLAAGLTVWQSTREVPGWKHAAVVDPSRAMMGDYDPHARWRET